MSRPVHIEVHPPTKPFGKWLALLCDDEGEALRRGEHVSYWDAASWCAKQYADMKAAS